MGKRGGRRRKRAQIWAEQQEQNDKEDNVAATGPDPKQKRSKTASVVENDGSDRTQVSLMGADSTTCNTLPQPFDINDMNDDSGYMLKSVQSVWRYFQNSKSKSSWDPSIIQKHLWSILLQSKWNTIGVAPTGSGKTLSYAIPSLVAAHQHSSSAILALVPTRELTQQVAKVFSKVAKAMKKKDSTQIIQICGGIPKEQQLQALQATTSSAAVQVLVATPGRLLDLVKTNASAFPQHFEWCILDEADQLAKDGDLGPQVDAILSLTRNIKDRRRLVLVSATYPDRAKAKFQEWVGDKYVLVQVDHVQQQQQKEVLPTIGNEKSHGEEIETKVSPRVDRNSGSFARIPAHLEQILHVCSEHKKPRKLLHTLQTIYARHEGKRSLPLGMVFFSKIEKLKYLSKLLEKEGIASVELHSQLATTKLREQHLAQFSCGQKPLLLATDLAARGIDIPSVQFVIQYDFPGNLQQYVHRCGRAGRSNPNKKATIYSFFTRNLKVMASDLIQLLEANNAWVDPNLRALTGEKPSGKRSKRKVEDSRKGETKSTTTGVTSKQGMASDDEVDDFPELSGNRIVLKRASHVSDASSSSSDEEDGEEN